MYNGTKRDFMIEGTYNCTTERECMIYDRVLWGFSVANLDINTLEAKINFPYAMNSKNSAPAILLDYLYVLMSRKGASKVTCNTHISQAKLMNSVMFIASK